MVSRDTHALRLSTSPRLAQTITVAFYIVGGLLHQEVCVSLETSMTYGQRLSDKKTGVCVPVREGDAGG